MRSNSFNMYAERVFLTSEYKGFSGKVLSNGLLLNNNNIFNRFIITKVDGDEIEIPIIAKNPIEHAISNSILDDGTLDTHIIVLPLYENSLPVVIKSFNTFFKEAFAYTSYNNRIKKIILGKKGVYYGGKGLILDDQYNPLLLCILKARKVRVGSVLEIAYIKPIIYVNPIIFKDPDKIINRGIIKNIIPYYTSKELSISPPEHTNFYNDLASIESRKAVVIVDNLDRFFVKPTVPKPQSCTNESLNECLVNNIDDILSMIL